MIKHAEAMNLANIHLALLQRMGMGIESFATSDKAAEDLAG